jgi:hypothetical protein
MENIEDFVYDGKNVQGPAKVCLCGEPIGTNYFITNGKTTIILGGCCIYRFKRRAKIERIKREIDGFTIVILIAYIVLLMLR